MNTKMHTNMTNMNTDMNNKNRQLERAERYLSEAERRREYDREREKRRAARVRRLKRERLRKLVTAATVSAAVLCMVVLCAASYDAIDTRANDGFKYYTDITVEPGQSLWEIAGSRMDAHYADRDSYIAEVCSINHLEDEDAVYAGQRLIIPYYSAEYVK